MEKHDRFHGRQDARRPCDRDGCEAPGEFRAPRKAGDGAGMYWFCLEHVRAYNAGWDFFDGMSRDEIEATRAATNTWERPTWPSQEAVARWQNRRLKDLFDLAEDAPFDMVWPRSGHYVSPADRRALDILGLDAGASTQEIKRRFKVLVRRYHPDSNQGDRRHEGRLRDVIAAYQRLTQRTAATGAR